MFAGEYLCKVDEKGRFIVPSPIRERLELEGNSVVFLKATDQSQSLWVYSSNEWEKVLERTRTNLNEDQSRLFMHSVVSEVGTSDVDKTGRILIPGRLRKHVPMDEDSEIIIVGLYHRLEVWNPAEWRRYISRTEDKYEQNLNKILNLL